jgi:hypothetical protein
MIDRDTGRTPHVDRLEACFRTTSPVFRDVIARVGGTLGDGWARDFDESVGRLLPDGESLAAAVAGYSRFALDALRLQARFETDGVYASKSFSDVADQVYQNDKYMISCYLPGLLLSHYLWPHHYRQMRFFEEFFVGEMVRRHADQLYDVGVGTGMYSRRALVGVPGAVGIGIDISPSSKEFAERHARAFGVGDRYNVELRDIVDGGMPAVSWLICVEVIEHLEDPVAFLRALRAMLRPGGKAFVGTALNAANADHIYLYRSVDDVRSQLEGAGFTVEQVFCASAGPRRGPTIPVAEVAAFVVV